MKFTRELIAERRRPRGKSRRFYATLELKYGLQYWYFELVLVSSTQEITYEWSVITKDERLVTKAVPNEVWHSLSVTFIEEHVEDLFPKVVSKIKEMLKDFRAGKGA